MAKANTTTKTTTPAAKKPAAAKPTIDPVAEVTKVAKATRIKGVAVETRQSANRPVVTITDDAGTRILAYVSPVTRGDNAGGFNVEVADYGAYRRSTVADIAAAAAAVKTSARIKPKAPKAKATKPAAAKAATKPAAKKAAPKKGAASAQDKRAVAHDVAMMADHDAAEAAKAGAKDAA